MITKGKIAGQPPLVIGGKYQLINMGFLFLNQTYVVTQISAQDCLVNPDKCDSGFTVGIKIKLDPSVLACKGPRFIVDTGPGVGMRGLSVYTVAGKVVAVVATSTKFWKVLRSQLLELLSVGIFSPIVGVAAILLPEYAPSYLPPPPLLAVAYGVVHLRSMLVWRIRARRRDQYDRPAVANVWLSFTQTSSRD